jgi:hypothetical protein
MGAMLLDGDGHVSSSNNADDNPHSPSTSPPLSSIQTRQLRVRPRPVSDDELSIDDDDNVLFIAQQQRDFGDYLFD